VRKAPGQARSKETVNVILEASARILEEQGLRGFNTNAVAAKAGVSVGSLYQYFPNKDAILLALIHSFERATNEAVQEAIQSGRGRPLKPCLRLFVRALVVMHYRRPRLNRVLEAEEERLGCGAGDSGEAERFFRLRQGKPVRSEAEGAAAGGQRGAGKGGRPCPASAHSDAGASPEGSVGSR
jgi:AcrR family transcriptional regulator